MNRLIFDLDGVLIRSEHLWRRAYPIAYSAVFQREPPALDLADMQGRRYTEIAEEFLNRGSISPGQLAQPLRDAFAENILATMMNLIEEEGTRIAGSVEFVRLALKAGTKPALASSSPCAIVEKELQILGLVNCFEPVITGERVTHGKPDPSIYLLAAEEMQIDPRDCLVVEDSPVGVASAFRAGMSCIMLTSSISPPLPWPDTIRCKALVPDLRLLNIQEILSLRSKR